jgi:hypothetical protein
MPDRPLPSATREAAPTRFWRKRYVVMGIVAVSVLTALAILVGGMFDTGEKDTTQPPRPVTTQSDTQAPAITQPSTQAPATGENKAP